MELTSEQRGFILAHEHEDVRDIALRFARNDMPLLLRQIAGRQMAEKKIPLWYALDDIVYPPHLSLEQSSSQLTALYKASLVLGCDNFEECRKSSKEMLIPNRGGPRNGTLADLTGGMGVDFSFLAPYFHEATYVEQNEDLCRIALHNFGVLGLTNATVNCTDAVTFLKETLPLDFIYLDPSRRDNAGQKVFRIEDCSPDLSEIKTLLLDKGDKVMVKYSPMLDISLAVKSLGCVKEVHVVSVDNECKELLFLLSVSTVDKTEKELVKESGNEPLLVAVNLKKSGKKERFTFTPAQEHNCRISYAMQSGKYLYEPNVSILKAGAFTSVSETYHLQKLHINSHLYTSNELVEDFPGRIFTVEDFFVPNKKNIKLFTQKTKKANIAVRNFPMSVAEIRRKTGLKEGGDIYLFATTLSDERKIWIACRKTFS